MNINMSKTETVLSLLNTVTSSSVSSQINLQIQHTHTHTPTYNKTYYIISFISLKIIGKEFPDLL